MPSCLSKNAIPPPGPRSTPSPRTSRHEWTAPRRAGWHLCESAADRRCRAHDRLAGLDRRQEPPAAQGKKGIRAPETSWLIVDGRVRLLLDVFDQAYTT